MKFFRAVINFRDYASCNTVGYIAYDLQEGFSMLANPFIQKNQDYSIGTLLANVPDLTTLYVYDPDQGYVISDFDLEFYGGWSNPNLTLKPGEGALINLPPGSQYSQTFWGEIVQGITSSLVPDKSTIRSAVIPIGGALTSDLMFRTKESGAIALLRNGVYEFYTYSNGIWLDVEPDIMPCEAFWIMPDDNSQQFNWVNWHYTWPQAFPLSQY